MVQAPERVGAPLVLNEVPAEVERQQPEVLMQQLSAQVQQPQGEAAAPAPQPQQRLRRTGRKKKKPERFRQFVPSSVVESSTDSSDREFDMVDAVHRLYHVCNVTEPSSLKEAMSGPHAKDWKEAADKEYNSLMEMKTWELVELPKNRKPVSCKWVFRVKHNKDGMIERFKSRLVARGFSQQPGIDFAETFSPVVRLTSICSLLAFAIEKGMLIHQMDVVTAFLNGQLEEEIYMEQPSGYVQPGKEHMVCKLQRSLYGLKQSPRCWNTVLRDYLKEIGFNQSKADPCVFVSNKKPLTIITVYVDDLVLITENAEMMHKLKQNLAAGFKMSDMGPLHYVLGVSVEKDKQTGGLWLSQEAYVEKLLEKYKLVGAKPVSTPADVNVRLVRGDGVSKSADEKLYQSIVGSLMYIAIATRPDIQQAVSSVSKYCANPPELHLTAAK